MTNRVYRGAATVAKMMGVLLLTGHAEAGLRDARSAYRVEVLVGGAPAPTFRHRGETYLLGQQGARYLIRVHNHSRRRVEVVVSVDGLDVIDGGRANYAHKRGYLVDAQSHVDIDGWRLSRGKAAAFRFSSVPDSYAKRTGRPRNIGVIGVAVFPERRRPRISRWQRGAPPAAPKAPFPGDGARTESPAKSRSQSSSSGLGTAFGEAVHSPITEVTFHRQNPVKPAYVLGVRYNDRQGLVAMGVDVDGRNRVHARQHATPFSDAGYAKPPAGWTP